MDDLQTFDQFVDALGELLGRAKNLSKSEVADELDMQAQALRDAEAAEG
jgi:hypothetical protein